MRFEKFLLPAVGITLAIFFASFPLMTIAALDDGLVAHYPFDGNATDTSGLSPNGTLVGPTSTTDRNGNPDSALFFDGIDDYIIVSHSDSLNLNSNGFAVSFFIQIDPNQVDETSSIFDKFSSLDCAGYTASGWSLKGHLSSNLSITYGDGANNIGVTGPAVPSEQWHHVIGMVDNNTFSFFIDGQLLSSQNLYTPPTGNTFPLLIGKWACDNRRFFFHGAIDDIRIYNRALTDEEISILSETDIAEPPVEPEPEPPVEPEPETLRPISNTDLVIQSVSIDPVTGELSIKATLDSSSPAWNDIDSNPDIRLTVEVQSNDGTEILGIVGDSSVQITTNEQSNQLGFGDIQAAACEVNDDDKHNHSHKHKHGKHEKHRKHGKHHKELSAKEWWGEQFRKAKHHQK